MLAVVHKVSEPWPAAPQLIGDVAPHLAGLDAVGLVEGLTDGGGHNGVLTLGDMGERVAHPMDATALPGGFEHARDRRLQAAMSVRDDQLDAGEAPRLERAQEVHPESLGLRWPEPQADDLSSSVGVGGHCDYGGNRDDPAALAGLEVGGIEPQIGPLAFERSVQELVHPFIDVLAQLGNGAL